MRSNALRYLLKLALFTVIYFGAAKVGFLFSLINGNVSLIWPATGVALAGLLLLGQRMWPAIALGAFLATLSNGSPWEFALVSAAGNTLAAVLSAYLLRRVGFQSNLTHKRDIISLILLGAVVGSTISAIFGAFSLNLMGMILPTTFAYVWLLWWMGDMVGVLIVTPFLLVVDQLIRKQSVVEPILYMLASFILGVSVISSFIIWQLEEQSLRTQLFDEAHERVREIESNLEKNIQHLFAIEGLYASSQSVERDEFSAFTTLLLKYLNTAEALAWVPHVSQEERGFYELAAREEGVSNFRFTEQNEARELVTAAERPEYFPVYFLEPMDKNAAVLGFDLRSDPMRLAALSRARDTGEPSASAMLTLVRPNDQQQGLLIFVPIYHNNRPLNSVEDRRANLHGFAVGVFRIDEIVNEAVADLHTRGIELFLFDVTSVAEEQFMTYASCSSAEVLPSVLTPSELKIGLYYDATINIHGREWLAIVRPCPAYLANGHGWEAWTVLLVGVLLSSAVIGYLGFRQKTEEQTVYHARLLENVNDAVLGYDNQFVITAWNRAAEEIYGWAADEVMGKPSRYLLNSKAVNDDWDEAIQILQETGQVTLELWQTRKDGTQLTVESKTVALRDETGRVTGYVSVNHDITQRKAAQLELEFQKTLLECEMEASPDGILIVSEKQEWLYFNQRYTQIWGFPTEITETRDRDAALVYIRPQLADPDTFFTDKEYLYAHLHAVSRKEVPLQDGRVFESYSAPVVSNTGAYYGRLWSYRDITQRRELEAQLLQAQKMEAIGRLAGGIAHDFNNLLVPIIGYADLGAMKVPEGEKVHNHFKQIRAAASRAANLTRQILAFSRKQLLEMRQLELNQLVADFQQLIQRVIGEDIELRTFLESDLYPVKADKGQIEQVLMNLVINARDAMPQGGKLTIETANTYLDENYVKKYKDFEAPGCYAMLVVSDTGHGMDAETQEQIFEPFFTTKERGKGTGLGLAMVFGIVKQHEGYIWVYSELERGTTFKIYLPQMTEGAPKPAAAAEELDSVYGTETILVVEDEEMVRKLVGETLAAHGYQVLEAATPAEALRKVADREDINLLLTDMIMPEMNGQDLYKCVIKTHPYINVLYISGYTDNVILYHDMVDEDVNFLQKPFTVQSLTQKVRQVLNQNRD